MKTQIELEARKKDPVKAFLERVFNWVGENTPLVVGAGVLLVLALSTIPLWTYFSESQERTAQEAFFLAEKSLLKQRELFEKTERDLAQKKETPQGDNMAELEAPKNLPTGNPAVDFKEALDKLDKVISEYPNTKAAQMAGLLSAEVFSQNQKWEEALDRLGRVQGSAKSHLLSAMISYKYGNLLAAKGDCSAALDYWGKSVNPSTPSNIRDYIRISQGLCFESINDLASAEKIYLEVLSSKPSQSETTSELNPTPIVTDAKKDAEKYLRALKFKKSEGKS